MSESDKKCLLKDEIVLGIVEGKERLIQ